MALVAYEGGKGRNKKKMPLRVFKDVLCHTGTVKMIFGSYFFLL